METPSPLDPRTAIAKKLVRAHERVLAHWSEEEVKSLATPVIQDPMYEPLSPSDLEAEFYRERQEELGVIELEPVEWATPPGAPRAPEYPATWRAIVNKGD